MLYHPLTSSTSTLSLPSPLPIFSGAGDLGFHEIDVPAVRFVGPELQIGLRHMDLRIREIAFPAIAHQSPAIDRKSTRLNSSHSQITYAVFCLNKKNNHTKKVKEK